jgi:carbamoyltransferase
MRRKLIPHAIFLCGRIAMAAILGVSAFYHDSAAALVVDGRIVAAAQEERFTRVRHDASFPAHAIAYCLTAGGIDANQLDLVAYYEKPLLKFSRILEMQLAAAPWGLPQFIDAMSEWLTGKFRIDRELRTGPLAAYRRRFVYLEHHQSHAASAFFPSPFDEAAILTIDGVGEWATATCGVGRGTSIELKQELRYPHSLGLLYSTFTAYCGFRVNSGEYKLMGLAPYGRPVYADRIRERLIQIREDGSFRLDLSCFDYWRGRRMPSRRFEALFGGPARTPESRLTQRECDLAASIQVVAEEVVLKMARHLHATTGMRNLCLAGGVALNCVANGVLVREGPFERVWFQPAAGDAGGALGAALSASHQLAGEPRAVHTGDSQQGSLLGPAWTEDDIQRLLDEVGAVAVRLDDEDQLCEHVAKLLANEQVVGWFQGRMEFGPRALGARSILGDARSPKMQEVMNLKIKFRESFRPFAPVVLEERVGDYWEARPGEAGPYMMTVLKLREDRRRPTTGERGLGSVNDVRSDIPAVTHVDDSARVQTVDLERHGRFRKLLEAFDRLTGCPVLINTSFNRRGEPIVNTPRDAWDCFAGTNLDALVLERFVVLRRDQPNLAGVDPSSIDRRHLD